MFRVLLVGDVHQHTSPGKAGDALRILLNESRIKREWLEKIVRQPEHAMSGLYLRAVRAFAQQKTTKGFALLDRAKAIHVSSDADRIKKIADEYLEEVSQGRSVCAVAPSHRECDEINEAIRKRLKEAGRIELEERTWNVHRTLGLSLAQRQDVRNLKVGLVIEVMVGPDKGKCFEIRQIDSNRNVAFGVNSNGERRTFGKSNAEAWALCQPRKIGIAVGDELITHSAMKTKKSGEVVNGHKFKVKGFDGEAIIAEDGKRITTRNLAFAHCGTSHRAQGLSADTCIFSTDRNSMQLVTQRMAYVAVTRGKTKVSVHCNSKLDLLGIEKRSANRVAAVELVKFCIDVARKATQHKRVINQRLDRAA